MPDTSGGWMGYINEEVRAACAEKDWGFQIRRKWSVREKPVALSSVGDYEWKLIPGETSELPDQPAAQGIDVGTYFVLSFDRPGKFVLQHDTFRQGDLGPHWDRRTYTEIRTELEILRAKVEGGPHRGDRGYEALPSTGWLKEHLVELTNRFQPNQFSIT